MWVALGLRRVIIGGVMVSSFGQRRSGARRWGGHAGRPYRWRAAFEGYSPPWYLKESFTFAR